MAYYRYCPMCRAKIEKGDTECPKCAVVLADLGQSGERPPGPGKVTGHDSNPNDPMCLSCGSPSASIYPGVLRGGGKGYCSDCYARMRRAGYTGVTEEGSSFSSDIRDLLKATRDRIEASRLARGQTRRNHERSGSEHEAAEGQDAGQGR